MTTYSLIKAKDSKELAQTTSTYLSNSITATLKSKSRCQIALPGGSTPKESYMLLKNTDIPWDKVDIFLGDERWVDPDHVSSNSLMLRDTLLSGGPASRAHFYPVPFDKNSSAQSGAIAFSKLIRNVLVGDPPAFDLILLGLGDDGHTASLFPGTNSLEIKDSITTVSSGKGLERVTLTSPILNSAKKVTFLVSGQSKRLALKRLLDPLESYHRTPAKLIKSSQTIDVLVDQDSCELI